MAGDEVAQGVEFADAPISWRWTGRTGRGRSRRVLEGAPGASGAALLDLDRPDRPLGVVVEKMSRLGRVANRRIRSSKQRNRRAMQRASFAVAVRRRPFRSRSR